MFAAILALTLAVSSAGAVCPLPARSARAVYDFRKTHPCPATGKQFGACPGWEVDHVVPLACCGKDDATNMRWLEHELHTLRHRGGLRCERFKVTP
jgi:hypothetical protein